MWYLMRSELHRFLRLAIGFAIFHFLVLRGAMTFIDLFESLAAVSSLGLLTYGLAGLIFGMYQMGSYKRLSQWAYLIHRPLSPARIMAALTGAGSLFFVFVMSLPQWLFILYVDLLTPKWIDARHYLLPLYLLGLALSFYLVGCIIALAPTRLAILTMVMPAFFLTRETTGLWIFATQLIVLAWLTYIAFACCKPDLSAPLRRGRALAALGLPTQYALSLILFLVGNLVFSVGTIVSNAGWSALSSWSWNDYWQEGTFNHVELLDGPSVLRHGLHGSDGERAAQLLPQMELAETFTVFYRISRYPTRHQLLITDRARATSLVDSRSEVQWTFSHDAMLFHGRNTRNGQAVGWMGVDGPIEPGRQATAANRFPEIPFVFANRFLVTPQRIVEFDGRRGRLETRFEVEAPETFATPLEVDQNFAAALTDRFLYLFDVRDLREPGRLQPMVSVPLPGDLPSLDRIDLAELLDSYLISFLYGAHSERGYQRAFQMVVEADLGGAPEQVIVERPLAQGLPVWMRHRGFLISPTLQHLGDLAWAAVGPYQESRVDARAILAHPVPAPIAVGALVIAVLSALATWLMARRRRLELSARRGWTVVAFVLSLPAFLSFLFLTRARERGDVEATATPSTHRNTLELAA